MLPNTSVPSRYGLMQVISVDELADMLPKRHIIVQKDPRTGMYDVSKVSVLHYKTPPIQPFLEVTDFELETEVISHDTKEIEEYPTLDGERLFFGMELALRLKEAPISYHYHQCELTLDLVDKLTLGFNRERGRTPAFLVHVTQRSWAVVSPDGFERVFCKHPITGKLYGTVVVTKPNAIYRGALDGR